MPVNLAILPAGERGRVEKNHWLKEKLGFTPGLRTAARGINWDVWTQQAEDVLKPEEGGGRAQQYARHSPFFFC